MAEPQESWVVYDSTYNSQDITCSSCRRQSCEIVKEVTCDHCICIDCLSTQLGDNSSVLGCIGCSNIQGDRFRCVADRFGCDFQSGKENLEVWKEHLEKCKLHPSPCFLECGAILPEGTVLDHVMKVCENRSVQCPHCEGMFPAKSLQNHLDSCQSSEVQCHACKRQGIPKSDIEKHVAECLAMQMTCKLSFLGCDVSGSRDFLETHQTVDNHLSCIANWWSTKENEIRELQQQVKVLMSNFAGTDNVIKEQQKKIENLEMDNMELKEQLRDMNRNHSVELEHISEEFAMVKVNVEEFATRACTKLESQVYDLDERVTKLHQQVSSADSVANYLEHMQRSNQYQSMTYVIQEISDVPARWVFVDYASLQVASSTSKSIFAASPPFSIVQSSVTKGIVRFVASVDRQVTSDTNYMNVLGIGIQVLHSDSYVKKKNMYFRVMDQSGHKMHQVMETSTVDVLTAKQWMAYPRSFDLGFISTGIALDDNALNRGLLVDNMLVVELAYNKP